MRLVLITLATSTLALSGCSGDSNAGLPGGAAGADSGTTGGFGGFGAFGGQGGKAGAAGSSGSAGAGGSGGSAGAAGQAGSAGSGGSSGSGGSAGSGGSSGSGGSAGSGGSGGCAVGPTPIDAAPLDWVLLLDRSASMKDSSKWDNTKAQLKTFESAKPNGPMQLSTVLFPKKPAIPPPTGTCSSDLECGAYGPCVPSFNQCSGSFAPNDSCLSSDYGADLPFGALPGTALTMLLSTTTPDGESTPMTPALQGAHAVATSRAQANPSHQVDVVMITDGEPTNCTANKLTDVEAVAKAALQAAPSARTFVVRVGPTIAGLDAVAKAGGTGSVHDGGATGLNVAAVLGTLADASVCRLPLPANINPAKISVFMTLGASTIMLNTVAGPGSCLGAGVYVQGKEVVLCPTTCTAKKTQGASFSAGESCQP